MYGHSSCVVFLLACRIAHPEYIYIYIYLLLYICVTAILLLGTHLLISTCPVANGNFIVLSCFILCLINRSDNNE